MNHNIIHVYRNWFLASRPWSFSMTAISVSVGALLGAIDGAFSWRLYLLTLAGVIFMHGAANLINDYYDVLNKVDSQEVKTAQYRPHPLVEGKLSLNAVRIEAYILFALAFGIGLYLCITRGWVVFVIGITGILAGLFYTAPPFKYKYWALGELSVFLMWGPLMVEGAYFVQRQTLSLDAFWISLPFGVLVALVILANNLRDRETDKLRGIKTIPILMSQDNGMRLYMALAILAYVAVIAMSLFGPLTLWSLIVLLSLPLFLHLLRTMIHDTPDDADAQTAKLNTVFGILLVISLILERIV
jgi:1,4-dihydroxy-2-naphthoate octaprenyltransferase